MIVILYFIVAILIGVPIYFLYITSKIKEEKRREEWLESQVYSTLRIDVPKNNEKKPLAAEQMFASIHGIYSESSSYQNHLSFEIVAKDKYIQFYVHVPKHLKDFVEGQIYAQYPTVEICEVEDYTKEIDPLSVSQAVCELVLNKPDVYPIRFFESFDVDPLAGITSVMSKLNPEEAVWFQLIIRPVGDEWQDKGNSIVSAVRAGKKPGGQALFDNVMSGFKNFLRIFISQAINPGAEIAVAEKAEVKLPASVEEALKGIEQKIVKLGFETKIRILSIAKDPITAGVKCQSIAAAFKQFNTTNLNGFKLGEVYKNDGNAWHAYVMRSFEDNGNIFNIAELSSIYHLPNISVETPSIVWSGAKKGEPPANLPLAENTPPGEFTVIGETTFRNVHRQFGIKKDDRRRHIYLIGKSGVGKSVLLENMAIDDVIQGRGVIAIDPHGDMADKLLSIIPDHRMDDVIVFDPADRSFPIAFNLLESVEDDFKGMVASGFVGIFKKIFGDSWGPRLEHILRNTVLALLDYPNSTMLDIPGMLTDSRFRDRVVEKVKDPVIRDFWVNEFAQYDSKFRTEAVSPILNKVGQFLATATIRNIVGQPHSQIDIRSIMDQKRIMIVNLSRGKIGEDNSALLGAMMVTKIQLAAMSRADVTIDKRPDCYLYVDEFQNFATDAFATILAEARKYNLNLTVANQFVAQMPESVRDAVFGNAGTIVSFRVGGSDADFLAKEYEPVFDTNDLVNLDKYNIYIKLLIDGISAPAFSARTLPPVNKLSGNAEKIIALSREKYSNTRASVEEQIAGRGKEEEKELLAEAETFRRGGLEALLKNKGSNTIIKNEPSTIKENNTDHHVEEPKQGTQAPGEIDVKKTNEIGESTPKNDNYNIENKKVDHEDGETRGKLRVFKYQNIIGDKIFKEQTARGGVKWYIGEKIDLSKFNEMGISIPDEALRMVDLAKKVSYGVTDAASAEENITPALQSESSGQEELKTEEKEQTEVSDDKNENITSTEEIKPKEVPNNSSQNIHTTDDANHLKEGEEVILHE